MRGIGQPLLIMEEVVSVKSKLEFEVRSKKILTKEIRRNNVTDF